MSDHMVITDDPKAVVRWRNAIIVAFAIGGIALATWGPRLPALAADLRLNTGSLGVLLAGVTVGSIAGLLAATSLLGTLGARRAIGGAIVLISVAITTVGVGAAEAHSVGMVGAGLVVAGFAIGALDVMINVEGAAIERAAGRTLMPLMHAAWSAGAAIGSGIGAACAALDIVPSAQFAGEAVLLIVLAVFVARSVPPGPREMPAPDAESRADRFRRWLRGWTDWRLLLIGLIMFGAEIGEGSANNWLTLAAKDGHGQPAAVAALFFTTFAVGECLARVAGGPLVDRFGRVWTVRVTTALGVVGVAAFILTGNPVVLLVAALLWAVGVSMGFPLGMSAAATGPNPAARVSVVAAIGYFANLAAPPTIGFVARGTSLLSALWLVAILLAVACAAAGALRPARAVRN